MKTKTFISLEKVKFHAYHGVHPQEQKIGNEFIIDIVIEANVPDAIDKDELKGTVNYADVYAILKEEMQIPSQLLEHVCGRITKRLFNDFPLIHSIDLKLSKTKPPIEGDIQSACVRMLCER